jgi:Tol biopolymer transport system component
MPGDKRVVFASTHLANDACPEVPPRGPNGEYVWPIYPSYDIFTASLSGDSLEQITFEPGYDAEATISPNGDRMVFTSTRSGDLELYTCNLDGSDVVQVTDELGYDGGAFFSPDGTKLIWRASRPRSEAEVEHYTSLLAKGLVEPTAMELFIANADGSDMRQLTDLGGANWAPFFHPGGESVLFSSNHKTGAFPFNIFKINTDGSGLEQVTFDNAFDSFPMFSPDGRRIAFSSNRNNGRTRNTNVFVADWVD